MPGSPSGPSLGAGDRAESDPLIPSFARRGTDVHSDRSEQPGDGNLTAGESENEWPNTGVLLLDASCLLNLYATGRLLEIAGSLPWQLAVVDYVMEQEALYVRTIGAEEPGETVPVDLSPLIDEGLLLVVRLETSSEEASFVDLAAILDDGEAMTGAIALNRGHSVAIDDRKARRVLGEKAPGMRLVSTLGLMCEWSASVTVPELSRALRVMQHRARYVAGQWDPLYAWWRDMMEGSDVHEP